MIRRHTANHVENKIPIEIHGHASARMKPLPQLAIETPQQSAPYHRPSDSPDPSRPVKFLPPVPAIPKPPALRYRRLTCAQSRSFLAVYHSPLRS